MSKRQAVKVLKGRRVKQEASLPPIGGTREEIQRTLVETMRGILEGRITTKEAWRIGHACNAQLRLLGLMEQLELRIQKERRSKCLNVEESKCKSGRGKWVN